jgi:4-hydroxy-tetrahydrodipicolinate synthase
MAGTGSNHTVHGIELSKRAQQLGVDALLQVTPYYNKTTQKGLVRHFTDIAKAVDVPIMLYNVPSRTGLNISSATAKELSYIDNIVAIKEASGNIAHVVELAHATEGRLDLYSGNDDQILPLLALGGKGVVSVVANVLPRETHDIVAKYMAGDLKGSLELQFQLYDFIQSLFCEVNPIPVKQALNLMGMNAGPCRRPLYEIEPENMDLLRRKMAQIGLITL